MRLAIRDANGKKISGMSLKLNERCRVLKDEVGREEKSACGGDEVLLYLHLHAEPHPSKLA